MGMPALAVLLFAGFGLVIVVYGIAVFNRLVALRVETENAWADIDVQLKRRHDLIPNLVETVKGYAGHERQTLESVVSARSGAVEARGEAPAERAGAERALTHALGRLFALSEAYPQLRAAEPFQELQRTLGEVEGKIQQARRYYNATVRELNTKVQQFPSNVVASAARIRAHDFFELEVPEEGEAPEVRF